MPTVKTVDLSAEHLPVHVGGLASLITSIGTEVFPTALLNYCHLEAGAEYVSIFSYSGSTAPELVGTATFAHHQSALKAASGYDRHFNDDVNFRIASSTEESLATYLTYQHRDDIASSMYRRDCYELTGIEDRMSLVRTGRHKQMAVSMYRSHDSGAFSKDAQETLTRLGGVLLAVIDQHFYARKRRLAITAQDHAHHLRHCFPALSPRECEVASMVIAGHTAAAIAKTLGISETTVITHRKNAYQRLGVENLRELLQLLM